MTHAFLRPPDRGTGLVLFLNAGDPPLGTLTDVVCMLDEHRVDCLELAVPFPDSVSDGPTIRRSAARALAAGVDLGTTLDVVAAVRPQLRHMRVVVLADWRHTVAPRPLADVVARVAGASADALLLHGLPPRLAPDLLAAADAADVPVVTSCYPTSCPAVVERAASAASAYVYLAAHRGRTGARPPGGYDAVAPTLRALRASGPAPVAVGFGVRTRDDIDALRGLGADGVVVGTAAVERVERALAGRDDVVGTLEALVDELVG